MINHNIPPVASLDSQLKDIYYFSFYKNPISNKYPLKSISLLDAFNLIKGTDYLEITNTLRSILELKEKI